MESAENYFFPHQLGVETPKGVEAALQAVWSYIQNEKTVNKVLLKVDFKNAFNQISHNTVLRIIYQCYGSSSSLFFGDEYKIESREGVQQWYPLVPFLFSLATMDLINSCKSELKVFYLDDGTLGGDAETVLKDYKTI